MAVLESKLIIGASDETGAAFASVMARITELSAKLASVNRRVHAAALFCRTLACNDGGDRRSGAVRRLYSAGRLDPAACAL